MITCPVCGQENPEGFRFCGACGSPLPADDDVAGRMVRKTVTVVFCDMAGSTALGDREDPERVRALMGRYHDLARGVLERHGATIEKFIGDAVMAVFGVPVLHEDDALRAVRAACELAEELAAAGIPARIGVNTGEVVAGGGEPMVTGDAVNVAARLEQAAGVGEVWIGDATHRLTRDAVHTERVGGLTVKGKPAPIDAHRLLSVSAHAQAIPRRIDSRLVGRELELSMLSEAFERSVSERCHLFTVMGAAGVGKSRLVAELAAGAAADATVLVGHCLPYGEGITFWPVAEMLRTVAGIGERDDREAARTALEALVADDEDGMILADRVACAIGLGGSPAPHEEVFWAVRRTFELVARARPTVLVFEDIHWAEPTLLDLIEHMADWARGCPLLVVCTARPDLLDARPAWAGGKTNATTILLEPLPDDVCGRLLDDLAGIAQLTPDQRRRVVAAAEGNPLFVEQMIAMLTEDGREARDDVPLTIQALLAARLDRLEGDERRVVESASVEGRVFHQSAVAALAPESARPALAAHLQRLMRRELIDPDRSLFVGDHAYRFQHVLIRDAAYASLPKPTRADLHERFAEWLEDRVRHRIEEYREILAYHVEQAYLLRADVAPEDPELPELAARATEALVVAARHAGARGDSASAYAIYLRAVAIPQPATTETVDLVTDAMRAGVYVADRDDMLTLRDRAEEGARQLGDDTRLLHADVLALGAQLMADTTFSTLDARATAERAAARFEAEGDRARLWDALYGIAESYHHEGRWNRMEAVLERAGAVGRELGDAGREQGADMARLGCAYWGERSASSSLELCDQLLQRWPQSLNMRLAVENARGRALGLLGRFDEADERIAEWLALVDRLGDRVSLQNRAFTTAPLARMRGDNETAAAETAWSAERLEEGGHRGLVATLLGFRGVILAELGRWSEAAESADRSRALSHPDDLDSECFWRAATGMVTAHRGDLDGAVRLVGEAIALIDRSDEIMFQADTRMILAATREARAEQREARAAVEEALDRYRRKECIPGMARATEQLSRLPAVSG